MFGVKWITSPPFTMISMVSPSRILIFSLMVSQTPNDQLSHSRPDRDSRRHDALRNRDVDAKRRSGAAVGSSAWFKVRPHVEI